MDMFFALTADAAGGAGLIDALKNLVNSVYGTFVGVSGGVAGICAVVCLFGMFFSKSQRTVETSTQWLKRIVAGWLAIVFMGAIVAYVTSVVGSQQLTLF